MGNLVQVLRRDGSKPDKDFFIDFENAQPTEDEQEAFNKVAPILEQAATVLADLEAYQGANAEIRAAISNANDESLQKAAWDAVCPLVQKLKEFYMYSSSVEQILPTLLESLCSQGAPLDTLEVRQALAKQFSEILEFVLKFDDLKMTNPAIQNDFSYYRRTLSRLKMNNMVTEETAVVSNEEANRMSLFYAYPTPMLKTISDATTKFVSENKDIPIENTTDLLGAMSNLCCVMIETPEIYSRFENKDTILFCQRVMVGVIILYDHVHLVGAFAKKNTAIDLRAAIRALKMHDNPHLENLLNALRFSTKHLNDESTPKDVKKMLSA